MSVSTRTRTYSWEDPMALRDAGAGLSGLDYLKAVFERRLPPPPIAATLDFTGVEVEEARSLSDSRQSSSTTRSAWCTEGSR